MTGRASKRTRGAIQNVANQLVQKASGWEAAFDGPVLLDEPATGTYIMDAVQKTSKVNGRPTDLGMLKLLNEWLDGELARLGRDRDWISEASVRIDYELIPSGVYMDSNRGYSTSQAYVASLSATAHVVTSDGSADASFENAQAVTGMAADVTRPMPRNPLPAALKGRWRPVEIKGKRPGRTERDT